MFTTSHVVRAGKPIVYVSHDTDDGSWQFHSDDPVSAKDMMILALEEILEIDPTVGSLANLPEGYCASRRDRSSAWRIRKNLMIPDTTAIQQSLAADGAMACFSSNLIPCWLNADRAPQLKAIR